MKNVNNKGFMLVETLIVTVFVAGVLIFLFIQFSNLSNAYDETYKYNPTEGLYALEDIKYYIESDTSFVEYLKISIEEKKYIDITNCDLFTEKDYCLKLLELENINKILITPNLISKENLSNYDEAFYTFIKKINEEGEQPYRLVASFNNSTYATLRFGDNYE